MNYIKNLFGLDKIVKENEQTHFPFWKQDFNELLKYKQQKLPWCEYFKRFIITEKGLQYNLTDEIKPFNILCDHYKTYLNENNTRICSDCGLIIIISQKDLKYLNKNCCHPNIYLSYKKNIKYCNQCKSNVN